MKTWAFAVAIFCVLSALTFAVWKEQVDHQRSLLFRHTKDVCGQASRRLQVYVESHLRVAAVFARRWATHELRDFSKRRFDEFADVLIQELPGYSAVGLLAPDLSYSWVVPDGSDVMAMAQEPEFNWVLKTARRQGRAVLSPLYENDTKKRSFYAALPLLREGRFLGYLIVNFDGYALINDCFHTRIESEFEFSVYDGDQLLFHSEPGGISSEWGQTWAKSRIEFPVSNRRWRLEMVPRKNRASGSEWGANISVPLLGLLLSVGLSFVVFLLSQRMEMYRAARDTALREITEREKAENALKASEARYRNVFDATTDGLLVLEPDGCIIEANRAVATIHGYQPEELKGRPVQELIAPQVYHHFEEFKFQLDQYGVARLDSVAQRRDGSRVDIEVRGTHFKPGDELKLLAIITDVSERKKAMEKHALLSRKVIVAQEEERARLSMELHDELGQFLTALRLEMGWLQKQIAVDSYESERVLDNTIMLAEKATEELRYICRGLRPPLLDDLGLGPALRFLVDEFTGQTGTKVDLDLHITESKTTISPEIGLCAYRIVQEALTNIRRHAAANRVTIAVKETPDELSLQIIDNGVGFNLNKIGAFSGYGLEGMRERSNLVDGQIEIRSAENKGTRIFFRVPLAVATAKETTW